jgi:hypothetical protein
MSIDIQALPEKIKKSAYWRVNFRPTTYKNRLTSGPGAAFDLVRQNQVSLRGWPYPFISDESKEQIRHAEYVASGSDFWGHIEYWRLCFSGQFIYLSTVREKAEKQWDEKFRKEAKSWHPRREDISDIPGFISIINLLYDFTEILEFAARMCEKGLYENDLEIHIKLCKIKGFELGALFPKFWNYHYPATVEEIEKKEIFKSEYVLTNSAKIALDWSIYFYSFFGWDNPPIEVLQGDQQKFLSGKI